jgi:hypothetical protein
MKSLGHAEPHPAPCKPNCGVTAVAVVARKPFDKVFSDMKRREGKRGNWKGRTFPQEIDRALKDQGVSATRMEMDAKSRKQTLKTFVRDVDHKKTMIIRTTGHIQVVKDGYVIDQTLAEPKPVEKFSGRNKRVQGVWMVWSD